MRRPSWKYLTEGEDPWDGRTVLWWLLGLSVVVGMLVGVGLGYWLHP